MKPLIVYYSFSGNTKRIADMLQKETGGELAEIKTVVPYTGDYNAIVSQGQDEVNRGYTPAIQPLSLPWEASDAILLGTPVWWYTFASAVKTFLETYDFNGKTVYPFVTNGGWLGHTLKDIEKICAGASVKPGINIKFSGDQLDTPLSEIERWVRQIEESAK